MWTTGLKLGVTPLEDEKQIVNVTIQFSMSKVKQQ